MYCVVEGIDVREVRSSKVSQHLQPSSILPHFKMKTKFIHSLSVPLAAVPRHVHLHTVRVWVVHVLVLSMCTGLMKFLLGGDKKTSASLIFIKFIRLLSLSVA